MARTILQQPDGFWCVWSSIVDDFITTDATLAEIENFLVDEKMTYFRKAIKANIEDAVAGKQRGFGPHTYKEALKLKEELAMRCEVDADTFESWRGELDR